MSQHLVYGMVSVGEDLTDSVLETLEQLDIPDEVWSWIIWSRGETYYTIIKSDLKVRGILAEVDGVAIRPVGYVAKRMDDNRNKWIEPEHTSSESAIEVAKSMLNQWLADLWKPSDDSENLEYTIQERKNQAAESEKGRVDAESEIKAAFGLTDVPEGTKMYRLVDRS